MTTKRSTRQYQTPEPDEFEIQEGSLAEQVIEKKFDFNEWLQEVIAGYGLALTVSIVVHVVFLFVAASWALGGPTAEEGEPVVYQMREVKPPLDMEVPEVLDEDLDQDVDQLELDMEEADHHESEDEEDFEEFKGDSYDFVSDKPLKGLGVYDAIGVGGGAGGRYGGPRGGRRKLRGRSGRKTESSVMSGLLWLARHQSPDGHWGAKDFSQQCKGTTCGGPGAPQFDIGVTGLALLAFTGAGYTNMSRDTYGGICFGDVVRKAALYLIGQQKSDGVFGQVGIGKFGYNQSVATYAMVDLYGLTMDTSAGVLFKDTAQRSIDYTIKIQNPGKAWRYQPRDGQNDTSVSGWYLMALKAAEMAELNLPESAFTDAKSFYDDVTDNAYGQVGYTEKGTYAIRRDEPKDVKIHPSLTAVGVMVRIFIDKNTSDPRTKSGVDSIIQDLPEWNLNTYGMIDYYYWFYASYCLMQYDGPKGPAWNAWEKKMKDVLLKSQKTKGDGCAEGSWDPVDRWGNEGGRVYATAINILTFEVYYRLGIITRMK